MKVENDCYIIGCLIIVLIQTNKINTKNYNLPTTKINFTFNLNKCYKLFVTFMIIQYLTFIKGYSRMQWSFNYLDKSGNSIAYVNITASKN